MLVSIMLYLGSKHNRSLYFVPWLTEQIIALSVGIVKSLILAMGGFLLHVSVVEGLLAFAAFLVNALMIYSVASHFLLLRKMKQHSKEIINSVMNSKSFKRIKVLKSLFK